MNVLETWTGADNLEFKLVEYTPSILNDVQTFCEACAAEGIENNSSLKAMKFGKWGDLEQWHMVYHGDKIIAISGSHYYPHFHKDCYRIMYRMATLKAYRGMASAKMSLRKMQHNFCFRAIMPAQVDWALTKGATEIIATANSPEFDNGGVMDKVHSHARNRRPNGKTGWMTLIHKDASVYNTKQDIFRVNVRDFATQEKIKFKK